MGNTLNWEVLTIAGFRALSRGDFREGAKCWIEADTALPTGPAPNPRHAAAHSNAGIGHLLRGHRAAAEASFVVSQDCWMRVADRIPNLDVPLVATSSSFHFRLASGNVASFTDARRRRYERIAEVCLEISRYNAMFAHATPSGRVEIEAAKGKLSPLLADVLGPRAPEIRLLGSQDEKELLACYAEKVANLESRRPSVSAALSEDCDHLETAFALSALFSLPPEATVDFASSAEPLRRTEP